MIKAVIIDDEPLATEVVRDYVSSHDDIEVLDVVHDGFSGVKSIEAHKPDLIFLDVQMPKINGLEMLELVDDPPAIIFTTAFEEYAIKAFEANAIDYLLKPFSQERFDNALDKLRQSMSRPEGLSKLMAERPVDRIVLKDQGRIVILPLDEVAYLEADDDYVRIYANGKTYLKKATLQGYESKLPSDGFVRVHRSYLVNVGYVTRIEPYEKGKHITLLKDGNKVPVSKTGYVRLKELLGI